MAYASGASDPFLTYIPNGTISVVHEARDYDNDGHYELVIGVTPQGGRRGVEVVDVVT